MAILSKTGITTGQTVEPGHVTQSIDAFTGIEQYDIFLSGSFNMTGSINGEPGVVNNLTASYAITSSRVITLDQTISQAGRTYFPLFVDDTSVGPLTTKDRRLLTDSDLFTYSPSANLLTVTASQAISSSFATTASYAVSASYAPLPTPNYEIYRATLTQTSTNAPVFTLLESSSLFSSSSFIYSSTGVFYFSSSGAFPTSSKVEVEIDNIQVLGYPMSNNAFNIISSAVFDADNIEIRTGKVTYYPASGSQNALTVGLGTGAVTDILSDDVLNNTRFCVKVWS